MIVSTISTQPLVLLQLNFGGKSELLCSNQLSRSQWRFKTSLNVSPSCIFCTTDLFVTKVVLSANKCVYTDSNTVTYTVIKHMGGGVFCCARQQTMLELLQGVHYSWLLQNNASK